MKASGKEQKIRKRKFTDALESTGYSKAKVARELGVSPEQVSRWREKPPRYAMAYLEQIERNQEVQSKLQNFIDELKGTPST